MGPTVYPATVKPRPEHPSGASTANARIVASRRLTTHPPCTAALLCQHSVPHSSPGERIGPGLLLGRLFLQFLDPIFRQVRELGSGVAAADEFVRVHGRTGLARAFVILGRPEV